MDEDAKDCSIYVPPKFAESVCVIQASPDVWPQCGARATKANTHQSHSIVNGAEPEYHRKGKCQDVRHTVQEWDRGEVGLWAVGRIVRARVERWAMGVHQGGEVYEDGIGDEFKEGLQEERLA